MIKEHFKSHYLINKPMALKDKPWVRILSNMFLNITNRVESKLCDTQYAVDQVGLGIYLSFIQDEKCVKLKNELPADTIFLFADKFIVDDNGNFDTIPKIVGIFTKHENNELREIFKTSKYYIYEIR